MRARRTPLLDGHRAAWCLAAASAAVLLALVWTGRLRPWHGALLHLGVLSAIAYAAFAWDKRKARRDARRISEANLLWLAVLGGAAGAWLAMRRRRHKTRRAVFRFGVPLALLAQAAAVAWLAATATSRS